MRFVFWQSNLSIHQSAFIRSLAEQHSVLLVAEYDIDQARLNDGWTIPYLGNIDIEIAPTKKQIKKLLTENSLAIQVFSGIKAFPSVHFAFNLAIKKGLKIGVITESGIEMGIMGFMRRLKSIYFGLKYSAKIDFILAMGEIGVNWYLKNFFPKSKIFPFFYAVENPDDVSLRIETLPDINDYKIIVIAQCIKRKGIDILIKTLSNLIDLNWNLQIIGDGYYRENLIRETKFFQLEKKISFLGSKQNKEAMKFLLESDLLILPSRFDGWGSVINEALMRGIPVVASNKCGAACLLDNMKRGSVFNLNDNSLISIIANWINRGSLKPKEKQIVANWAKCISGENAAKYFLEVIQCVYENAKRPNTPWLEEVEFH